VCRVTTPFLSTEGTREPSGPTDTTPLRPVGGPSSSTVVRWPVHGPALAHEDDLYLAGGYNGAEGVAVWHQGGWTTNSDWRPGLPVAGGKWERLRLRLSHGPTDSSVCRIDQGQAVKLFQEWIPISHLWMSSGSAKDLDQRQDSSARRAGHTEHPQPVGCQYLHLLRHAGVAIGVHVAQVTMASGAPLAAIIRSRRSGDCQTRDMASISRDSG